MWQQITQVSILTYPSVHTVHTGSGAKLKSMNFTKFYEIITKVTPNIVQKGAYIQNPESSPKMLFFK